MIFSTRNGEPLAMMNDGILHHVRVAAGAALGVRYLAREDASVVGCLGSGGMARAYLPAFCAVRKIARVKVYSPTKAHREAFADEMSRELGIPVEPYESAGPVVRGSDIVTTCTDSNQLVVTDPDWIEKGMHLANCSSKEFSWEIVKRCDIVVQVGSETFGAKGGMAESERHHGWASWVVGRPEQQARIPKRPVSNLDFINYPSLTDLLNDASKRRTSRDQITFFHNLGLLGISICGGGREGLPERRAKGRRVRNVHRSLFTGY